MSITNSVHLIGYLMNTKKKDPSFTINEEEMKRSYYSHIISVRRGTQKDEDGNYKYDSLRFKAFGHTANYLAKYVNKGDQIAIEGEIIVGDNYEKDGEIVYGQPEILVREVRNLTPRNASTEIHYEETDVQAPSASAKLQARLKKASPFA